MLLKSPPALGSLLAAALLMGLAGCSQAQSPKAPDAAKPAAAAKAGDYPAVLKGIQKHGFEVVSEFDAPGGGFESGATAPAVLASACESTVTICGKIDFGQHR